MKSTQNDEFETYEVEIETSEGRSVTRRITGQQIAVGRHGLKVFLTTDERVLTYDENRRQVHDVSGDPASALEGWF